MLLLSNFYGFTEFAVIIVEASHPAAGEYVQ